MENIGLRWYIQGKFLNGNDNLLLKRSYPIILFPPSLSFGVRLKVSNPGPSLPSLVILIFLYVNLEVLKKSYLMGLL